MCAGAYKVFEKKDFSRHSSPQKIFVRESFVDKVDEDFIFTATDECILFYEKFFQTEFPFEKYDTVFAPEFRINGMENVAMTVMAERMLASKPMNNAQKSFFGRVLTHEVAHTWFGDLVSVEWWDSVWLKESFADFCCGMATSECKYFLDTLPVPMSTILKNLYEALTIDNQHVTHPIYVDVQETTSAVNAFDHICYRKGANFIRLLVDYVGEEVVKEGIKLYMERYSYKCAKLLAIIEVFDEVLKKKGIEKDLAGFAETWLHSAGPNSLEASVEEQEGGKYAIRVKQGLLPYGGELRALKP